MALPLQGTNKHAGQQVKPCPKGASGPLIRLCRGEQAAILTMLSGSAGLAWPFVAGWLACRCSLPG